MTAKAKKKKVKKTTAGKQVVAGKIFISASFNNTLVTITNYEGETLAWGSSGASGFKGTRKSTPFAATTAVDDTLKRAISDYGIREVEVYIKGPGPGRDASLRAIKSAGLKISLIADVTPIPHNGPRPKKKRRG
jgi:small subunit ribosomal protein S11